VWYLCIEIYSLNKIVTADMSNEILKAYSIHVQFLMFNMPIGILGRRN